MNLSPPPAGPGGWLARTAYRLGTGDMSVEDADANAYPDAWQPNGPPGAQMGMGGGTVTVDNSSTVNLVVDRGALQMDLRVAADADADRVGIIVRDATTKAFQLFLDQLQRQLGKRIRVRI